MQIALLPAVLLLAGSVFADIPDNKEWGPYGERCLVPNKTVYDPSVFLKVPWYTIDMDLPPKQRWAAVAAAFGPKMQAAIDVVKSLADGVAGDGTWEIFVHIMRSGPDKLKEPYQSEIVAMSELTGIDIGELTLLNLFYEIARACTSIVAQGPDGRMYHGRNLDFGFMFNWNKDHSWDLTDRLKDVVINVEFTKSGFLLFKGVTYAGHLGIMTGVRPNGFSVSTNTRMNAEKTLQPLIDFFLHGLGDEQFEIYAIRDMLMNYDNFDDAVNYMKNVPMMTGAYLTMSGPKSGQGVILTRAANGTIHVAQVGKDGWYVLETNYDWDKNIIFLDDRRGPGNDCMKQLGQSGVSFAGLYQVLSSKPTLNKATTYTALMQVNDGLLETVTRVCEDPCWFV